MAWPPTPSMTLLAPFSWLLGVSNASSVIDPMWFWMPFDGVAFPAGRVYIGHKTLRVGEIDAPEAA
jgi:hypothetical protein